MGTTYLQADTSNIDRFVDELSAFDQNLEVLRSSRHTVPYGFDRTSSLEQFDSADSGPTVVRPHTVAQVQETVRLASVHGISIVPRGAGTGLSGGATANRNQIVLSTEKLNGILEISAADGIAVVEPGVLNGELNRELEPLGFFYAPDPASAAISSVGGNIATNAGGMRCAKYGVTRESVLALQVVLPDSSLISIGHRSLKGVTGLDLVSLFVGSEGTLGVVVQATLRIRPLPVARRTLTVFFDQTSSGARAVGLINSSTVQPAALEFLDGPSLAAIDEHSGTELSKAGAGLLLIELDGYGINEQVRDLTAVLEPIGGRLKEVTDQEGAELWELRRSGRGFPTHKWHIGEDIAVPTSKLGDIFDVFEQIEEQFGVKVSAVAHAGDGNLHPLISLDRPENDQAATPPTILLEAATELVKHALAFGGTVTGEHGIGTVKLHWADLELSERVQQLQRQVKGSLDPNNLLNPGKAL